MSKIVPAIDEDVGCEGSYRVDLEYRRKGQKRWQLGGGGPLTTRNGRVSKRMVERAKRLTVEDETIYRSDGKIVVPKLEFRIVQKQFLVKRRLISEKSLS
ncbi:MAG: hypothetical protein GF334_00415 [Candidatus Altiarchaeales archaeon]|nr:hypothetical protein [Candidatus Altiarchaeales archaeon]